LEITTLPGCSVPPSRTGNSGVGVGLGGEVGDGIKAGVGEIAVAVLIRKAGGVDGEQDTTAKTRQRFKNRCFIVFSWIVL